MSPIFGLVVYASPENPQMAIALINKLVINNLQSKSPQMYHLIFLIIHEKSTYLCKSPPHT